MLLTKVGLFNTVNLCKLNVSLLESSCGFFIMRSQSLAVTTPFDTSEIRTKAASCISYHGAKNSTSINASGLTVLSKLAGVRSRTSEARTAWMKASAAAEVNRRENRIVKVERRGERRGFER